MNAPPAEPDGAPAATLRCSCCGHFGPLPCPRCGGAATWLSDARGPLRPGRGLWPFDLLRGARTFAVAVAQVLHHRAFIGQLTVPVLANLIAFGLLAALVFYGFLPEFQRWFAAEWPLLDGYRQQNQVAGPVRMTLVTVGLLWPAWFDLVAGGMVEPLCATTERAVGGAGMARQDERRGRAVAMLRVRYRARLFLLLVPTLPAAWLLVLLPWVGLPLSAVVLAAAAAAVWLETPAARRGLDLRQHLQDLRRNWALALGFGLGCQLGMAVPFVNLVLLAPAAVVGASVLHFQFDKTAPQPRAPGRPDTRLAAPRAEG